MQYFKSICRCSLKIIVTKSFNMVYEGGDRDQQILCAPYASPISILRVDIALYEGTELCKTN